MSFNPHATVFCLAPLADLGRLEQALGELLGVPADSAARGLADDGDNFFHLGISALRYISAVACG
eukprot:5388466-Alexandrium_andersonii.AAC.1